jgi:hypothetical protein
MFKCYEEISDNNIKRKKTNKLGEKYERGHIIETNLFIKSD